jgi:hypothetical protein
MPEFESFMMLVKSKLPEIDGSAKVGSKHGGLGHQNRSSA